MIVSEFDGTFWWVIVEDELWEHAQVRDYYEGIPIYVRR